MEPRPDFSISRFKEALGKAGGLARPVYFTAQVVGGPFGGTPNVGLPTTGILGNIPVAQYWPLAVPWIPFPRRTPTDTQHQVMMCRSAKMPDMTLQTTELSYFSRKVKIPSSRTYEPMTLTFLHVNDAHLRDTFESWLYTLNHPQLNMANPTHDQYSTIILTQYDMSGRAWWEFISDVLQGKALLDDRVVSRYVMHEAFPVSVSGLALDHEADMEIQTYDVQFQYQWIEHGRG